MLVVNEYTQTPSEAGFERSEDVTPVTTSELKWADAGWGQDDVLLKGCSRSHYDIDGRRRTDAA